MLENFGIKPLTPRVLRYPERSPSVMVNRPTKSFHAARSQIRIGYRQYSLGDCSSLHGGILLQTADGP